MPVISSRISGWRGAGSVTLPEVIAMPPPAPTAPKTKPRIVASTEGASLVVLGDGAAEIDGSQGGEDERLQGRDQADLEEKQDHAQRERDPAQHLEPEQHGE